MAIAAMAIGRSSETFPRPLNVVHPALVEFAPRRDQFDELFPAPEKLDDLFPRRKNSAHFSRTPKKLGEFFPRRKNSTSFSRAGKSSASCSPRRKKLDEFSPCPRKIGELFPAPKKSSTSFSRPGKTRRIFRRGKQLAEFFPARDKVDESRVNNTYWRGTRFMRPPYGHGPYGHGPTCNLHGRKANRNAPHAGSRNQRAARFPEPACGAFRVRRDRNCLVPGTAPHAGSRNWGWGFGGTIQIHRNTS